MKTDTSFVTSDTDLTITKNVIDYISTTLPLCIRNTPVDTDEILNLPYSYISPGKATMFRELFYWDTYFTNKGLLCAGYEEYAINNANNLLKQVERHGYVPNSNSRAHLNRSQPPYLSMIVNDIFHFTNDREWLAYATPLIEKEYNFWIEKRSTPTGLNRYFHNATEKELKAFYDYELKSRKVRQYKDSDDALEIAAHFMSEAESGWDFNARFDGRCSDFVPVDLNSNLYLYEIQLENFNYILGNSVDKWKKASTTRRKLFQDYCWDKKNGCFYDYDYKNSVHSNILSSAVFSPLWAGLVNEDCAKAVVNKALNKLEFKYGLSSAEYSQDIGELYQWHYPNGWACLSLIATEGLFNYGFVKEAFRIAEKYITSVNRQFATTGELWEKYNVVDGTMNVSDEYPMPPLMGWTAGVYLYYVKCFLPKFSSMS